ncbi:uncharacterized protein VTP21DRAFT_5583 [Calcarisporiella thermophila]|uniref:uncharacterized protein n=1 Tax=Calcarisporiella thermophila TaxID=911321 RepID=UPI0037436A4C
MRVWRWLLLLLVLAILPHGQALDTPLKRVELLTHTLDTPRPGTLNPLDRVRLNVHAYGQTFRLHLEPNAEIFHAEATATVYHDGDKSTEAMRREDWWIYRGWVIEEDQSDKRWIREKAGAVMENERKGHRGWARIVFHREGEEQIFEGAFTIGEEMYHIRSARKYHLTKRDDDPMVHSPSERDMMHKDTRMIIYSSSDMHLAPRGLGEDVMECGTKQQHATPQLLPMPHNSQDVNITAWRQDQTFSRYMKYHHKRQITPTLGVPRPPSPSDNGLNTGCPKSRKILYLGMAADCTYVRTHTNVTEAKRQIITNINIASGVYEKSFNVSLGIILIDLRSTCGTPAWNQECSDDYTINSRLNDFSMWRGTRGDDGAGLWHLMTKCNTGTRLGLAWIGQLCSISSYKQVEEHTVNWVSGTGISTVTRDEWKVVAHEIGHSFGANHDCTEQACSCKDKDKDKCDCCPLSATECDTKNLYLMNPTSNVITDEFSPCSIRSICSSLVKTSYCLQDPGKKHIESLGVCGNGILEEGEECDPGEQDDDCCIAATCKLKPNAACSDANHSCCEKCQPKAAGSICRQAISECDLTEVCTGVSPVCPEDKRIPDGTKCGSKMDLRCASGLCTSRDAQCAIRGDKHLNLTRQCQWKADICDMYCVDPDDAKSCIQLTGNFIDGTPCGNKGVCTRGQCIGNIPPDPILDWIQSNSRIVIPVAIVIGLLVFVLLFFFIRACVICYRKRRLEPLQGSDTATPASTLFPSSLKEEYLKNESNGLLMPVSRLSTSSRLSASTLNSFLEPPPSPEARGEVTEVNAWPISYISQNSNQDTLVHAIELEGSPRREKEMTI